MRQSAVGGAGRGAGQGWQAGESTLQEWQNKMMTNVTVPCNEICKLRNSTKLSTIKHVRLPYQQFTMAKKEVRMFQMNVVLKKGLTPTMIIKIPLTLPTTPLKALSNILRAGAVKCSWIRPHTLWPKSEKNINEREEPWVEDVMNLNWPHEIISHKEIECVQCAETNHSSPSSANDPASRFPGEAGRGAARGSAG